MIRSTIQPVKTIRAEPPISFPFVWKSMSTGNVYLRMANAGVTNTQDMLLVPGNRADPSFVISFACNHDSEAWNLRLRNDEVVLSNTV